MREFINNLRFADDVFLCTGTSQGLQQMLQELSDESRQMGLMIDIVKTKVIVVDSIPINVNTVAIENVEDYVYLGQYYSLIVKNQNKEIQRRIIYCDAYNEFVRYIIFYIFITKLYICEYPIAYKQVI